MVILIIFILCIYFYIKQLLWKTKWVSKKKMLIFGHRGAPAYEKENTLVSFLKAIEQGADGIELDLQKSKDNHIIIHHDETLKDEVSKIKYNNFEKIQKIQKKDPLNTIEDIKEILSKIKILNLEIKSSSIFNNNIEKDVINFIEKNQIINKTIVSSFNPIVLYKLKKIKKNLMIGYLFTKEEVHWSLKTLFWAKLIKPDILHVDIKFLNSKIMKWSYKKRIPVFVFTINKKEEYIYVKELGVQGIFTDDPKKMKEIRQNN